MPEFRQNEASLWASLNREAVFGTALTAGANYLRAPNNNPIVLIPEMEKTNDADRPGNDSEFPTAQCNQYWLPPAASFQDQAGFNLFGRLALRAVGGTVTATTIVPAVAFKYEAPMLPKASGLQLPGTSLISELGGASYLFPGMVVDRFRMSQDGVAPVQVQFDMIGIGKHKSPHAVTALPALPSFACLKPKSFLQYNDGALQDLTVNCRVRSWSVEIANNHAPTDDRCIGDPTQNANDFAASGGLSDAAYLAKLTRGSRSVSAQITLLLDSTISQFLKMAENTAITGLTFGARGAVLDGAGPTFESLKVIIANSRIVSIQEVDSNGKAAITLTFQPMHDAATVTAKVEVVNGISAGFD